MNISFIGFGHMAQAIATGLLHHKNYTLSAAAPSLTISVNQQGIQTHPDNLAILPGADVVILAVKPMQMESILKQIKPALPKNTLIISIAAGLTLPWFEKQLAHTPMVRAMPNMAAAIGKSATPLMANPWVSQRQKENADLIFSHVGITTWLQHEKEINAFTALSGSGPAYVFLFIEALITAATTLGMAEPLAKSFALQTVNGALSLALESTLPLHELRQQVTSPKGTTEAAIQVLNMHHFDKIILEAMRAAEERAQQLGSF